jgi:threonine/homoserine/homoserine lactone efflux protein
MSLAPCGRRVAGGESGRIGGVGRHQRHRRHFCPLPGLGHRSDREARRCVGPIGAAKRAAVGHFFNPRPWFFWTVVGAPVILQAPRDGIVNAALLVLAFYVGLIGIKVVLSVAVAQGVDWFGSGLQHGVLGISAAGLAAVGVVLLATGVPGLTQ